MTRAMYIVGIVLLYLFSENFICKDLVKILHLSYSNLPLKLVRDPGHRATSAEAAFHCRTGVVIPKCNLDQDPYRCY